MSTNKTNKALEELTNEATEALAAADANDEREARSAGQRMADTLRKHRAKYGATIAYSGKSSLDNDDAVARVPRQATPQQAIAVAQQLHDGAGRPSIDMAAKYAPLERPGPC